MSSPVAVAPAEGVGQDAEARQTEVQNTEPRWLVPALALFAIATTVKLGIRQVSDP